MAIRPQIPAIEGVADPQVASILAALKSGFDKITGRTPNAPQISFLGPNSALGGVINKVNELIGRLQDTATSGAMSGTNARTVFTNCLTTDVALNNAAAYFDGPSVPQGTSGTWMVFGQVTITDTVSPLTANIKLWDGVNVIASGSVDLYINTARDVVHLSGTITNPAGNLRISVQDTVAATGKILANSSGANKDSSITAVRIG